MLKRYKITVEEKPVNSKFIKHIITQVPSDNPMDWVDGNNVRIFENKVFDVASRFKALIENMGDRLSLSPDTYGKVNELIKLTEWEDGDHP